ncbi:MAG: helix-turn-helix transcriptional regulator [Pseudomonadota bacterium]
MRQLSYMAPPQRDWIHLKGSGASNDKLTPRQRDVLMHIANGLRADEIAHELGVSVAMVRKHEADIRKRLGARTNAHAVFLYYLLRHFHRLVVNY